MLLGSIIHYYYVYHGFEALITGIGGYYPHVDNFLVIRNSPVLVIIVIHIRYLKTGINPFEFIIEQLCSSVIDDESVLFA